MKTKQILQVCYICTATIFLTFPVFSASVKDFGAVGDGIVDDTSSIQNAINKTTSGTLIFPSGKYKLRSPLILKSGVTYQAQGSVTLLGNGYFWIMQTGWSASNQTITGFTFDNGGLLAQGTVTNLNVIGNTFQNLTSDNHGGNWPLGSAIFSTNGLRNSRISQNTFKNLMIGGTTRPDGTLGSIDKSNNQGLMIYGLDNTSIDHNTFDHVGEGMHLCFSNPWPSSNVYIGYNKFTKIHRMGMEVQGAMGCGARQPARSGPDTTNMVIENNSITDFNDPYWWSYAISLANPAPSGGDHAIVRNNYIIGSTTANPVGYGYGIEAASANLEVYGNTLAGYWKTAVVIDYSPNAKIHDNFTCGMIAGALVKIAPETRPSPNAQYYNNNVNPEYCPSNIPNPLQ
jgi:hypothetical protein